MKSYDFDQLKEILTTFSALGVILLLDGRIVNPIRPQVGINLKFTIKIGRFPALRFYFDPSCPIGSYNGWLKNVLIFSFFLENRARNSKNVKWDG